VEKKNKHVWRGKVPTGGPRGGGKNLAQDHFSWIVKKEDPAHGKPDLSSRALGSSPGQKGEVLEKKGWRGRPAVSEKVEKWGTRLSVKGVYRAGGGLHRAEGTGGGMKGNRSNPGKETPFAGGEGPILFWGNERKLPAQKILYELKKISATKKEKGGLPGSLEKRTHRTS